MYVCMSVHNGFTTEVYEFTYPLACVPQGLLHLAIRYGRLRGETMMPGQRMRPEVQKTFKSDEK